jgi:hypothetical protein
VGGGELEKAGKKENKEVNETDTFMLVTSDAHFLCLWLSVVDYTT